LVGMISMQGPYNFGWPFLEVLRICRRIS
jgi:hypothetical protein